MNNRFHHARKLLAGGLVLSSCAFFLMVNQNQINADTANSTTPVTQTTQVNSSAANSQPVASNVNVNDQGNYAWLDQATVQDQTNGSAALTVSGWHATNQAQDRPNHYLILLDQTAGHEVARQRVQPVARPDVAKVHSDVANAAQSGFSANFPLSDGINLNHQLQLVSRYTSSSDGNSNYVDYWFSPLTVANPANQGFLDGYNYSDGQHLTFSGWHATDLSPFETNHFAILFDNTANSQVAVTKTSAANRPDVARAFPQIKGAGQSGFTGSFDLTNTPLTAGHRYSIVSRYSTSNTGNGDQGQYTDFWSAPFTLDQTDHYFDNVQMTNHGLALSGWMIADGSATHSHPYVIVLNNGREVARQALHLQSRPDVAKVFPKVFNSLHSGFSTVVNLNPQAVNGTMQVILRFTDDPAGNGNYIDQYSPQYATNGGWFDNIAVNGNNLYVSGWHASNQAVNKPYQYLIFLNQDGHELYRQQVLDKNRVRNDVAKQFPATYNSDHSGYQLGFAMPSQLNHQLVRVIHRITDDPAGNGNYVDYESGLVPINLMRTPIDYTQPSEYGPYPDLSKLHNFWIHVRIGQNRVYLMDGNNVVYTMYCTAGRYVNGRSLTPTGTYYVQNERGDVFDYGIHWTSWLNHGEYLFHSVVFDAPWHVGHFDQNQVKWLGVQPGSHGCIRLAIPDANWIQHNVPAGTRVVIDN